MNAFCKRAALSFVSLSLLASCDNPNAASAGNFEKALQRYYDTHPICVSLPVELPLESSMDIDDMTRHQLDALVKVGLLSATGPRTAVVAPSGLSRATGASYAVTAAGGNIVRKGADHFIGGTDVCFAHRQVTKVETFTLPAELIGMKVSSVSYDYSLKDVEPWASDGAIQDAFPRIRTLLAVPPGTGVDGLVLTKDGWQHEPR